MRKVTLALIGFILLAGCESRPPYTERIEEKYNIDVIAIRGKYGDGDVIYIDSEGKTCAAAQAPDDVLITQGCGEI